MCLGTAHASVVPPASAQTNGLTLQDIPRHCAAWKCACPALEDQPDMFPQVPTELAVAVTTRADRQRPSPRPRAGRTARRAAPGAGARAWAQLAVNQPQAAIADAPRADRPMPAPQHATTCWPRAYQALGHRAGGARRPAACCRCSRPYRSAAWAPTEDTGWLTAWRAGTGPCRPKPPSSTSWRCTRKPWPICRVRASPHCMVDAALAADPDTGALGAQADDARHYAVALRVGVKRREDIPPHHGQGGPGYPGTACCHALAIPRTTPLQAEAVQPPRGSSPATSRHPHWPRRGPGGCWAPCCAAP